MHATIELDYHCPEKVLEDKQKRVRFSGSKYIPLSHLSSDTFCCK